MTYSEYQMILKAIDDEPEYPGDMSDEMYEYIRALDKDGIQESMRISVRLTKQGIKDRLGLLVDIEEGD